MVMATQTSVRPRRDYHFGDLRTRALRAARRLVEESGPAALHLRDLAQATGAGVGSLYHHFADKRALMSELAVLGFRELEAALRAGLAGSEGPISRRAADIYLDFVAANPALYGLMYEDQLFHHCPHVRAAERLAYGAYLDALRRSGRFPEARVEDVALGLWAVARGIASSAIDDERGSPDMERAGRMLAAMEFLFARD